MSDKFLVGWWCVHSTYNAVKETWDPFDDGKPYEVTLVFPRGWRDQAVFQDIWKQTKAKVEEHAKRCGCDPTFVERTVETNVAFATKPKEMRVWDGLYKLEE